MRFLLSVFLALPFFLAVADDRPNFVVILVDDMGWTDVGAFGSTFYDTPNIDALAEGGMKFTQGYANGAVCSPTRASLMTGKSPWKTGVTDWIRPLDGTNWTVEQVKNEPLWNGGANRQLLTPRNPRWLEHSEITIAELLKNSGYITGFVGKWHLGPKGWWPEDQGFDFNAAGCSYGHPPHYFDPYPANSQRATFPNLEPRKEGEYLTDREAFEAAGFIRRSAGQPFFLMLAHYAVHSPIQAKANLIEKYESKQPLGKQDFPAYAAMVESVDDALGTVVDALKATGEYENTLIIFTSDNGGAVHFRATDNSPLRKGKGFPYEGGTREPYIFHWKSRIAPGSISSQQIITADLYPTLAELAGLRAPHGVDGMSLAQHLTKGKAVTRSPLIWHFPHYWWGTNVQPYSVIRKGDLKLIYRYETDSVELYNLREDLSETKDLASSRPILARALKKELLETLLVQGAKFPQPNPNYQPK